MTFSFRDFKLFLLSNSLLLPFTFFSINAILSLEYLGVENSSSYLISIFVSSLISYTLFLLRKEKFTFFEIKLFYFMFLFCFFWVFYSLLFFDFIDKSFFQFLLFVVPAIFFSLYLARNNILSSVRNYFLIGAFLNTLGFVSVIPKMLSLSTNDLITFYGGGHYQGFSYSVSFAFLTCLVYFLFYNSRKNYFLYIFFILIFLLQISVVIFSGGRGGLLVILAGLFICFYLKFNFFQAFFRFFWLCIFVILLLYVSYPFFSDYHDRFLEGFDRLFSYLSVSGIDLEQTSNRDVIYNNAINLISNNLFLGYGFFGYLNYTDGYPHNFFLEILLQGGIVYLLFWAFVIFFFLKKFYYLINSSNKHLFLIVTTTYSFVQLLFSGSYILEPFFWFSLFYVFSVKE